MEHPVLPLRHSQRVSDIVFGSFVSEVKDSAEGSARDSIEGSVEDSVTE